MRFPDDVAQRAASYFRTRIPELLTAETFEWSLPLQAPTAAIAFEKYEEAQNFIRTWQDWSGPGEITFEDKHWHRVGLGIQQVPTRISTTTPAELAKLAGAGEIFAELQTKLALLGPENTQRAVEVLPLWRDLPAEECAWVPKVVDWFRENPASGLRPRAVAVAGVHGKWLERNARLVLHLLGAEDLGLFSGDHLVRLRILDPTFGNGLTDISTPLAEAATMWPTRGPRTALIVENKETFLSLTTAWPETIAVWGAGYALGQLSRLPWLHRCDRILYWGDLDSDGFAILHQLRSSFTTVESVMMSPADVHRWAHLGVPDPGNFTTVLPLLSPAESDARQALLTSGKIRIEQERIPWDIALNMLNEAVIHN
ncbi:DUF2220 family protein [Corynebacterium callunae]|uniref:Wadjet anti-phage system protein JetD domain-containing protein n=1 Tax=Corynebacterium callunae TaxID=1721 RepID=UPI0039822B57